MKLLWAVKFDIPSEHSIEFCSSPFIAEIYRQTYLAAAYLLREKYADGMAQRLEDELSGEHTFEIKAVEKHIEFLRTEWNEWSLAKKREYVKLLLSPFEVSEEKIDEIIRKHL